MKRSGPPARRTPLRAKTPLERHTDLRRTSPLRSTSGVKGQPAGGGSSAPARGLARLAMKVSRPKPAVPDDVRAALKRRSDGWCEAQLPGCFRFAMDPHHRITQKAGGRHGDAKQRSDRLSNLIYLCRACHDFAHHKPFSVTNGLGLRLGERQIPPQVPVVYRGRRVYLADAGEVHEYEAHCA